MSKSPHKKNKKKRPNLPPEVVASGFHQDFLLRTDHVSEHDHDEIDDELFSTNFESAMRSMRDGQFARRKGGNWLFIHEAPRISPVIMEMMGKKQTRRWCVQHADIMANDWEFKTPDDHLDLKRFPGLVAFGVEAQNFLRAADDDTKEEFSQAIETMKELFREMKESHTPDSAYAVVLRVVQDEKEWVAWTKYMEEGEMRKFPNLQAAIVGSIRRFVGLDVLLTSEIRTESDVIDGWLKALGDAINDLRKEKNTTAGTVDTPRGDETN